ncbi:g5345 [Coccomyxa elongata]
MPTWGALKSAAPAQAEEGEIQSAAEDDRSMTEADAPAAAATGAGAAAATDAAATATGPINQEMLKNAVAQALADAGVTSEPPTKRARTGCCVIVGIQPGRAPAVDARMQARRRHLRGEAGNLEGQSGEGKSKVNSTVVAAGGTCTHTHRGRPHPAAAPPVRQALREHPPASGNQKTIKAGTRVLTTTQALDALAVAAAEALEAPRMNLLNPDPRTLNLPVPTQCPSVHRGGFRRRLRPPRGGRGGGRSGFGRKGATAHQAGKFQGNK